jgi:alpha-L-arabinofuranosidase
MHEDDIHGENPATPLIYANNHTSAASPSFYLLQMFARHRGDVALKTEVDTYCRPLHPGDSLPSVVAAATWDKANRRIILKVANTTLHNEITGITLRGATSRAQAHILQLKGLPEEKNTLDNPLQIQPLEQTVTLSGKHTVRYTFPPASITVLLLDIQ